MIAIIGAMESEVSLLQADLTAATSRTSGGFELHEGELAGHPVCVARAGVGKVNAAALAMLLVLNGARAVIFTGVAGALDPRLKPGDVVLGSDCVQHDVDVTALDYAPGQVPGEPFSWPADPALLEAALAAGSEAGLNVMTGRILSGDSFVASQETGLRLRQQFGGTCVEMEGAAVAQVCARAGVPCLVVRAISDSADGSARPDFREFTELAAGMSRQVVLGTLARYKMAAAGE